MAKDGWFDGQGMDLFKIGTAGRGKEWEAYLADGVVDIGELKKQFAIVKDRLRKLEPKLSDALHKEVTELIMDYELLNKLIVDFATKSQCYPLLK